MTYQLTGYRARRDELPYEVLPAFDYRPSIFESFFTRKTAVEDRSLDDCDVFFPFAEAMRIPKWVREWKAYNYKHLLIRQTLEQTNDAVAILLKPRGKRTLHTAQYFYEALTACVQLYQHRSGRPVRDRTGQAIWPKIDNDGYPIVEEWVRDDGGRSVIRAVDLPAKAASYQDIASFMRHMDWGPLYAFTPWKGRHSHSFMTFGAHLASYPLGTPVMRQIDYRAPVTKTGPTTHGAAKWAEGSSATAWLKPRGGKRG